eukprot:TRINITY_DN7317_c0_g2_i4.p2 TRINITY_DN7317_c0_g2~~TRINITY_DN7317_c0_g2_i4.p2  ORF type:complete len:121 (-),score=17.05 TRINITY_DN7317_c0_g2_i4:621-983(-)
MDETRYISFRAPDQPKQESAQAARPSITMHRSFVSSKWGRGSSNKSAVQKKIVFENKMKTSETGCESCGVRESPEWRRGPTGDLTLCNACGLRFKKSQAEQTESKKSPQDMIILDHETIH